MEKQIKLELGKETGKTAEVCSELGKAGVNIRSLLSKEMDSKRILHFITNDPKTAKEILEKKGFEPEVTDILILSLKDSPGELGKTTRKIAHEKIDVKSLYLLEREEGEVKIAIETNNPERTREKIDKVL